MSRRRWVALGLALVIAWAAVRFVAPLILGWPVTTCIPENPPAGCPDGAGWRSAGEGFLVLLPVTDITLDPVNGCTTVRYRYLGGFEMLNVPVC